MATAAPMSLNLILGHSARSAISTMERCRAANTICVVSPSPRASRRMNDEDLILTFRTMGSLMKRLTRMEAHFYSSNLLWLPAKALTAFLNNADKLEDFLLNGVRIRGSDDDIVNLAIALLQHSKLRKTTFFNIAPLPDPDKRGSPPPDFESLVQGVTRNPNLREFKLQFAEWANKYMAIPADPVLSELTTLVFSGRETLFGPAGDGVDQGIPDLMESLKANVRLQELRIQQAAGPVGTGDLIADMLKENSHLKRLYLNVSEFSECLPIASVLEQDNTSITHLELFVHHPMKTQNPDEEARKKEILAVQTAFETALLTNGSLLHIKITSRAADHTTETIKFYTRMNVGGRMEMMMDETLTGEETLEFLDTNSLDTSFVFHMLTKKAIMLPLVVGYCSVPVVKPKKKRVQYKSDSDSDDDKPIQFLASKAKAARAKRKKPVKKRKSTTIVQAAPARTLKRRRHK